MGCSQYAESILYGGIPVQVHAVVFWRFSNCHLCYRIAGCFSRIFPKPHRKIFQWGHLKRDYHQYGQFFRNKLKLDLTYLYKTWDLVHTTLVIDDSFFNARKSFHRLSSDEKVNEHTFKQLQVLDYFLDNVDRKQFVLNLRDSMNLTERDYESQI